MILLTGFGPFPGVDQNASAELVMALADVAVKRFPKKRIVAHVLPTEWQAAPIELAKLYEEHRPFLVLHFGVSQRARGFRIELEAHNSQLSLPDAAGCLPQSETVLDDGPLNLPVSIPYSLIVDRLRGLGVAADLSQDAGTYLCNRILYDSLMLAGGQKVLAMAGFIHVPIAFAQRHFVFDMALKGGLEIIRVCLKLPALAPPPRTSRSLVNRR